MRREDKERRIPGYAPDPLPAWWGRLKWSSEHKAAARLRTDRILREAFGPGIVRALSAQSLFARLVAKDVAYLTRDIKSDLTRSIYEGPGDTENGYFARRNPRRAG